MYTYINQVKSQSQSGLGDSSIRIGNQAFTGPTYFTTQIIGGQLTATGLSTVYKYYAYFCGSLAHERHHANQGTMAGYPTDVDSDFLANLYEMNTTNTDPMDPISGSDLLIPKILDNEIYANGPIEEAAIQAANTSQDWANPGTNSKP